MIIGHIPAAYLLSSVFHKLPQIRQQASLRDILGIGILGAITPDLDLIYFYHVDAMQHHHSYFTHYPLVWAGLLILAALWFRLRYSRTAVLAIVYSINGLLHMVLDSIASEIWWFAPFSDKSCSMLDITARFEIWWLNFIIHPVFLTELGLTVCCLLLFRRHYRFAQLAPVKADKQMETSYFNSWQDEREKQ